MEENNQVAVITSAIEVFRTAPETLKSNQERTAKALRVGAKVLDQWTAAWAIPDETARIAALYEADAKSNDYLVKCGNALGELKDARAAITQMMDQFKDMFFEAERQINKVNKDTIPNKIQVNRDLYVKEAHNISERKRQEAEDKANRAKEVIKIRGDFERALTAGYNDYVKAKKVKLSELFNGATLETFQSVSDKLYSYKPSLNPTMLGTINPPLYGINYVAGQELTDIKVEVTADLQRQFEPNYLAEMTLYKEELIDKLPSQFTRLQEEKKLADEAEAARKEAEQAKSAKAKQEAADRVEALRKQQEQAKKDEQERKDAEARRLQEEAAASQEKSDQELEIKKQGEDMLIMFEKEAEISDANPQAGQVKKSWVIEVLHPVGYTQLFATWFELEGKNLPVDKIGATKLDGCKAYFEKRMAKDGYKIESKFLKYDNSFKAVNRKQKETV